MLDVTDCSTQEIDMTLLVLKLLTHLRRGSQLLL